MDSKNYFINENEIIEYMKTYHNCLCKAFNCSLKLNIKKVLYSNSNIYKIISRIDTDSKPVANIIFASQDDKTYHYDSKKTYLNNEMYDGFFHKAKYITDKFFKKENIYKADYALKISNEIINNFTKL